MSTMTTEMAANLLVDGLGLRNDKEDDMNSRSELPIGEANGMNNEYVPHALRSLQGSDGLELDSDQVLGFRTLQRGCGAQERWVWCECQGGSDGKGCVECNWERGWWDDQSTIDANFTTSGDNPVLVDQAFQNDEKRSAGGWSDVQPNEFQPWGLHCVKSGATRKETQLFSDWMLWLQKGQSDKNLWKALWRLQERTREAKKQGRRYLPFKYIKSLVLYLAGEVNKPAGYIWAIYLSKEE